MGAYIAQWLLTVLVLLFVVYKMHVLNWEKENILFLFLEIPPEHTSQLSILCEQFLANYVSINHLIEQNILQEVGSTQEALTLP